MFRAIKEFISKIDNHVDMLDDLQEYIERAIRALRKDTGY